MNRAARSRQRIGCYLPTPISVVQQPTAIRIIQIGRRDRPTFVRIVHHDLMDSIGAVHNRQRFLTPNAILEMQNYWAKIVAAGTLIVSAIKAAGPTFSSVDHAQTLQAAQAPNGLMRQIINPTPASISKTIDILRRF